MTVVTPCLNAAVTIERTIRSVANQAYPNLEYIVCDGGSSDGTLDIIERAGPGTVAELVVEKDKNTADALNKGFRRATGEIFCYMNADDEFAPGALLFVAEFFAANPDVDVLTGACRRVFADGSELVTTVPDNYLVVLPYRNDLEQPSTFWRAAAHRKAGEFDDSFRLAFDWEWWNRLRHAGAKFAVTNRTLSVYYFTDANLTSTAGMKVIEEMYAVTRRYAPNGALVAKMYWFLFRTFDMRGCYDRPFAELPRYKRILFGNTLRVLHRLFGRTVVHAYNWNWASKQIRGLTWYKPAE